ncbi:hypothetical protein [Rhodococcus artemisiae]|uniref:Tyr recombinase domain-containing protein n=1 Tax=Rhodococcus artemisiae TaxID=714159 RepID=A0ABU7LLX7_9NOCA|nr:hypothetical protein [Rhodococcus artemisiae]MEE2062249.1 hypothetical protein [Rhodococcus artemisiae]
MSRRDASSSLRSITPVTEDQHPHWIRELLTGTAESLPYRVAGTLLLLYDQPLVKIASLQTTDNFVVAHELRLVLGADPVPVPVPAPFAALLEEHCTHRPNLRTTAGTTSTWLFPDYRHGSHLHLHTLMDRIRNLGVDLLGARNAALRALVTEVPPPLVAEMLGYSHQVAHKHTELAADPYARYAAAFADRTRTIPGTSWAMSVLGNRQRGRMHPSTSPDRLGRRPPA